MLLLAVHSTAAMPLDVPPPVDPQLRHCLRLPRLQGLGLGLGLPQCHQLLLVQAQVRVQEQEREQPWLWHHQLMT